jgi:hypothetical protein
MEQIEKEPVPQGLRDHIAIQAMHSMIGAGATNYSNIANESYKMADSMLKARKETKTE